MTRIAINRCFGGFGISDAAFERYLDLKGITWYKGESKFGTSCYYTVPEEEYNALSQEEQAEYEIIEEGIVDATGRVIKKVAQTAGKVVGGVAKTAGAIRQTPAAIGAAYNKGRAGAHKAIAEEEDLEEGIHDIVTGSKGHDNTSGPSTKDRKSTRLNSSH